VRVFEELLDLVIVVVVAHGGSLEPDAGQLGDGIGWSGRGSCPRRAELLERGVGLRGEVDREAALYRRGP